MKFLKKHKVSIMLLYIVAIGCFLRFYNLNWDNGHFLHPDERLYVNASNISFPHSFQEFLSIDSPLNPNMFYYGSFPLYLYSFIYTYIFSLDSFLLTSRFISAFFSVATIPIVFLIGQKLFDKKIGLFAAFIFAFAPGSIQHAHFNTTESILVFLVSIITLLSVFVIKNKKLYLFSIIGVLVGISYATKITGLSFLIFPFISFVILLKKKFSYRNLILYGTVLLTVTIVSGLISAPYQLIDKKQFFQEQEYMQGVITGKYKPPFTIIYENTLPYIYQITNILPFTFGFISFPISLIGLYVLIKRIFKNPTQQYTLFFILVFPILYFLGTGAWYAKFSRYYILLFPFLAIWSGFLLHQINKKVQVILLVGILLNGFLFMKIYVQDNTRVQASNWIYSTSPQVKIIAHEHWDDALPLPTNSSNSSFITHNELPVYDPDTNEKFIKICNTLSKSDYFVISSRRVYHSILVNKKLYPLTINFYNKLFNGDLGYILERKFTNYPYFFSDDIADESFQSYDHPPVLIYQNNERFSSEKICREIIHQVK